MNAGFYGSPGIAALFTFLMSVKHFGVVGLMPMRFTRARARLCGAALLDPVM